MKLENITIVFHSIMHYNPFDRLSYVTLKCYPVIYYVTIFTKNDIFEHA